MTIMERKDTLMLLQAEHLFKALTICSKIARLICLKNTIGDKTKTSKSTDKKILHYLIWPKSMTLGSLLLFLQACTTQFK